MATKRVKNPESLDAIDIALARSVDSVEARALLEKQARLIDSQETLARADLRHRGWQIIGERVAALLKALTVLVGMALILGIVLFFWSAKQASGMVMDPFSVPPAMDRQGLTGSVVAQQLLDKIAALETGTQSARASSSYENSWSGSKGVAVPYTGVSLGELRREARDWLGSEKHLSGDVVQLPGGRLSIAFRAGAASGQVVGNAGDFGALLDQLAILVFRETQPYRYTIWLRRNDGNEEEMRAVYNQLIRGDDARERLWGLHGLANMEGSASPEYVAIYRRALEADPTFLAAIGNLPYIALSAGRDEISYRGFAKSAKAYSVGQPDYTPSHARRYGLSSEAKVASYEGDLLRAAQLMSQAVQYRADDQNTALGPFEAGSYWGQARDFAAAQSELAAAGYLDAAARAKIETRYWPQESLRSVRAAASDDHAVTAEEALAAIERNLRAAADAETGDARRTLLSDTNLLRPGAALALARIGKLGEARAILAGAGNANDAALRARAFIATLARDPAADRLFAAAAARTPSLPTAQILWAEAMVTNGRYAEAEAHARAALKLGPNALEARFWLGEALLGQGKAKDAERAFADAARDAPRWGRLQLKWASALWMVGDRNGAIAKLNAARSMLLNRHDRIKVERMLALAHAPARKA